MHTVKAKATATPVLWHVRGHSDVLPWQVQRTSAYIHIPVCSGHFTDVLLQPVPRVSVETNPNLGSHIGKKEGLVHMFLTQTVITSSCHVTPVKSTPSIVWIKGPKDSTQVMAFTLCICFIFIILTHRIWYGSLCVYIIFEISSRAVAVQSVQQRATGWMGWRGKRYFSTLQHPD